MPENIVVYGKNYGEAPVALTIRLEWLPDGTIKPLMYWTPDGTHFQVTANIECTRLAYLKERGEGLRFKVKSEIIETPEPDDDTLHSRHETYLYLADGRFSEKNIVDDRYGHPGKEYIPVTLDVFPNGEYELVSFWVTGARYTVENTLAVEPRGSFHAGGTGIRHKVSVRLVCADNDNDPDPNKRIIRLAAVYREINKWFVSVINTA